MITTAGRITVALVDDHRVVAEGLRRFLESFPDIAIVGVASSGEDLLTHIHDWHPDVVVLDLLLPGGIDGIETTRRVMRRRPESRIVALTASTDIARKHAVLRAGAMGYVRKDADPTVLLQAVRSLGVGRSFIAPLADGAPIEGLSPRELDVLREVARGRTNRDIADVLSIGEETVKTHVSRLLSKLEARNRAQLVAYAMRSGFATMDEL